MVFQDHRVLSSWRSAAVLGACYLATLAAIVGLSHLSGWSLLAAVPLAMLVVAAVQGHMSILLHEGAHYLLHPNRKANELLAQLAGMPLLFASRHYRTLHLAHHEHSGHPEKDPERMIYRRQKYDYTPKDTWSEVTVMLLKDLFVINSLRFLLGVQDYLRSVPRFKMWTGTEILGFLMVHGVPMVLAAQFGVFWLYVLVWYGTLFTLTFFFLKLHIYGEHTGATGPTEFQRTWHHRPNPVFDFFVYPIRSGFHLEHHMFPSVPWHKMASFHRELMKIPEWSDNQKALDSDGYFFGQTTIWRSMIKQSPSAQTQGQGQGASMNSASTNPSASKT
jgi:fatty acid desaturase